MQIEDKDIDVIQLSALDIEVLLPEVKTRIQENAMLDNNYREACMQVVKGGNANKGYSIKEDLLC